MAQMEIVSVESKVVAYSPGIFQAAPIAFFGNFGIAFIIAGDTSNKFFTAGFGYGYSGNKTDYDLASLKD